MNKYFTTFKDIDTYNSFIASAELPNINVSYISDSDEVKYFKEHASQIPFTLEIVSLPEGMTEIPFALCLAEWAPDGFAWPTARIKYSKDNGTTWSRWYEKVITYFDPVMNFDGELILHEGDKVMFIGENIFHIDRFFIDIDMQGGYVKGNISGNTCSFFFGDDFAFKTFSDYGMETPYGQDPWGGYNSPFHNVFNLELIGFKVIDAGDLWLPGTYLPDGVFQKMFAGQDELISAPNIYAKYLPDYACENMFLGCSALTTMPDIYTTTLGKTNALDYMFKNCSSLVTTTPLRVNHIESNEDWQRLFVSTFEGCTSLTTTPQFSLSQIEDVKGTRFIINSTFKDCISLTNCTWELDSDIFAHNIDPQAGFDYVFQNCSSLTTAPIIRANASYPYCEYPYEGCTSLSTIFYLVDTWEAGSMGNFTSDISTLPSTGTLVLADGVSQEGWLGEKVPATWTIKTWSEYQGEINS